MSDGKQPDLTRLVRDYHAALYRYAYRLTGSAADAEDLTQQTFLLAQEKLSQLRDAENAKAWLYSILRNCFLQSVRKWAPAPEADLKTSLSNLPEASERTEIDRERLQGALDDLPAEFKLILLMYYFEDYSYREIAAQLKLPIGTVMSRLSRAKQHLRIRLLAAEAATARHSSH